MRPLLPAQLVAWNCRVGRRKTFPTELTNLPTASIFGFNEADGHHHDLTIWARKRRLRRVQAAGGVALYVGTRVRVIATRVEHVKARWRGPKGKLFTDRPIVWALVEIDGRPLLVVVQHAPWNPLKNAVAWRAYQDKLAQIGTRYPYADMLLVGDGNQRWTARAVVSLRRTAARFRGRYIPTGAPIDYGIFRPGTTQRWTVTGHKGARQHSDHPAITYTLTPRGRAA